MNPAHGYQPHPAGTARPMIGLWGYALNTASLYGEVLLRSRFGERHLTLGGVVLGILGIQFLPMILVAVFTYLLSSFLLGSMGGLFAALMTTQLPWANGTVYFHLFFITFLARACWHFCEMEYRRRYGLQVLSTYSGMPNVLWRVIPGLGQNEAAIKRFGEPAVLLLFALWVRQSDFLLTLYLATSAVAMFVKGNMELMQVHQRIYETQDQLLEAQALSGHVRGPSHQPGDVRGVATPAVLNGYPAHQARALTHTFQQQAPFAPLPWAVPPEAAVSTFACDLDPAYQRLLSTPVPPEPLVGGWYESIADEPLSGEWYESVSEPESLPANLADEAVSEPAMMIQCPRCRKGLRFRPEFVGRTKRCGNRDCGYRFLITNDIPQFPVPVRFGVTHVC